MKSYVARQAIFNSNTSVYGYELLYRENESNKYNPDVDGSTATKALISNIMTTFNVQTISDNKLLFINFTAELIGSSVPYLLSPDSIVIEILETVQITDTLIENIRKLKEHGYVFAIDDYVNNPAFDPLIELVDYIKVDFQAMKGDSKYELPRNPKFHGKTMLAEKVETLEEFERAKACGYTCFQGYYFVKPLMFSKMDMDVSPAIYHRIMAELKNPHFDYDRLAEMIKLDAGVTYKLLHGVNTIGFFRKYRIQSIKQALTRMGSEETFRWFSLLLIKDYGKSSSNEILKVALVRGRFCQDVMRALYAKKEMIEDAFLTGMFSVFDIIMGKDFDANLDDIGISETVRNALRGELNIYREVLDFALIYERGHWDKAAAFITEYKLNADEISDNYVEATTYADVIFGI